MIGAPGAAFACRTLLAARIWMPALIMRSPVSAGLAGSSCIPWQGYGSALCRINPTSALRQAQGAGRAERPNITNPLEGNGVPCPATGAGRGGGRTSASLCEIELIGVSAGTNNPPALVRRARH